MHLKSGIKIAAVTILSLVFFILKLFLKRSIAWINYKRIGHLGLNSELFLRRIASGQIKSESVPILISCEPANFQLFKMVKRKLKIHEFPNIPINLEIIINKSLQKVGLFAELPSTGNEYYEFNEIPQQLSFVKEEKEQGESLKRSIGISPDDSFVCFHSRDSAYLDAKYKNDWRYFDFRDCNIENYLPAAKYLTSLGIFALRMGYIVEKSLSFKSSKIIDYANDYRSDFGDIYFTAECKFFLGNTSGICALPWVFGVPSAYANVAAISIPPLLNKDIFIPKKLWDTKGKRFLSFKEIILNGIDLWSRSGQYQKSGIELIENTSDEILDLAKEMNSRLDGTWFETDEDVALQERYRSLFPEGHICFGFRSKIGSAFLQKNIGLLD